MVARLSGAGDGHFRSDLRFQTAVQRAIVSNVFPAVPWRYTRIRPPQPTRGFLLMFDAHALDHVLVPMKANPAFPTSFPCSLWQPPVSFATKDLFPFGIFVVFFTKSTLLRCKMLIKKH